MAASRLIKDPVIKDEIKRSTSKQQCNVSKRQNSSASRVAACSGASAKEQYYKGIDADEKNNNEEKLDCEVQDGKLDRLEWRDENLQQWLENKKSDQLEHIAPVYSSLESNLKKNEDKKLDQLGLEGKEKGSQIKTDGKPGDHQLEKERNTYDLDLAHPQLGTKYISDGDESNSKENKNVENEKERNACDLDLALYQQLETKDNNSDGDDSSSKVDKNVEVDLGPKDDQLSKEIISNNEWEISIRSELEKLQKEREYEAKRRSEQRAAIKKQREEQRQAMLVMQDIEMEQLRQETDQLKKEKIKQEHEFKEEDKKIKEFAAVQKTEWEKKAEEKAIADMMEENELKIEAFMKLEDEREQTRLYQQKKKEEAKTAFEDIKRQY